MTLASFLIHSSKAWSAVCLVHCSATLAKEGNIISRFSKLCFGNGGRLEQPDILRVISDVILQIPFGRLERLLQSFKFNNVSPVNLLIDGSTSDNFVQPSSISISRFGNMLKFGVLMMY